MTLLDFNLYLQEQYKTTDKEKKQKIENTIDMIQEFLKDNKE